MAEMEERTVASFDRSGATGDTRDADGLRTYHMMIPVGEKVYEIAGCKESNAKFVAQGTKDRIAFDLLTAESSREQPLKDHNAFFVKEFVADAGEYLRFADQIIASARDIEKPVIVINCESGMMRTGILMGAIYMRLVQKSTGQGTVNHTLEPAYFKPKIPPDRRRVFVDTLTEVGVRIAGGPTQDAKRERDKPSGDQGGGSRKSTRISSKK